MLKKFKKNDIFINTMKTHPQSEFFIYEAKKYYNNEPRHIDKPYRYYYETGYIDVNPYPHPLTGADGFLATARPYPFVTKNGTLTAFRSTTVSAFNSDFSYGDTITGSYPMTASISRDYYAASAARKNITALSNTLLHYKPLSSVYNLDYSTKALSLISIPSIFYGSSIKKGSVKLKFYLTGTLIGELQDSKQNGELIEVSGSNTGSVAGLVLYNEGFLILTGSWNLNSSHTENYIVPAASDNPKWVHFGTTGSATAVSDGTHVPSSSFGLSFEGTNYTNVITMLATADRGEFNHSNNPTFVKYNATSSYATTGSGYFRENKRRQIKNTVTASFTDSTGSFERQTYISRIAIYDDNKNLIAIAKPAAPIRKREKDAYTFKLKLDI